MFSFDSGKSAEIHYGTGAISGFFSQDHIKVGDFVVKKQVSLGLGHLIVVVSQFVT